MYPLKLSTAITVPFFVHDANGDGVTGLVDAGFTKRISKGSGAFAAMTVTITEMENGWYSAPVSTAHTDTLGILSIVFKHASAKQVNLQFRVFPWIFESIVTLEQLVIINSVDSAVILVGTGDSGVVIQSTTHEGLLVTGPTAGIRATAGVGTGDAILAEGGVSGGAGIRAVAGTGVSDIVGKLGALKWRKNEAQTIEFSMFDTSGNPKIGLVNGDFTSKLESKDGAAPPTALSGAVSEVGNGLYKIPLTAAEKNADEISFIFKATGSRDTLFTITTNG